MTKHETPKSQTALSNRKTIHQPRIILSPGLDSATAIRLIFEHLNQTIQQNENGVIAGEDPELLHDFRVAIRRTRSALTQINGVLPEPDRTHFKAKFKTLGKTTNRLRDLDVYLQKRATYQEILPLALQPGLNALFEQLQQERDQAHKAVIQVLQAPNYKNLMQGWRAFLQKQWSHSSSKGQTTINNLSKHLIYKQYKKVIKQGHQLNNNTPDEARHALRITCKNLRYILEFFASLFPPKKIGTLISHLKLLQDHLGDFNDLSVQKQDLQTFLNQWLNNRPTKKQAATAASMGGLIVYLHEKQNLMRHQFEPLFDQFDQKKNRQLFRSLFKT